MKSYARQSAPTDGRDASGAIITANKVALTSKQNSDASGIRYQWGRKDPFTFATSSESNGKYPIKIYTIDGVLIYQESNGSNNKDKQPVGGVIYSLTSATSMIETIKNPITFYGGNAIISQVGHTKSLWDYYWTSYSRGADGMEKNTTWHNSYLDGYASQRLKSIYDPCPYGFRTPSTGSYNQLSNLSSVWISGSYIGGSSCNAYDIKMWLVATGLRNPGSGIFFWSGQAGYFWNAIPINNTQGYCLRFDAMQSFSTHYNYHAYGWSVRCIELQRQNGK